MQVLKVKYSDTDAAQTFCKSLRNTGFAVLTDHPISMDLVNTVYGKWQEFFAGEDKHKYTFDVKTQAGYFPFKSEHAKGYNIKDLKEFFHVYPILISQFFSLIFVFIKGFFPIPHLIP